MVTLDIDLNFYWMDKEIKCNIELQIKITFKSVSFYNKLIKPTNFYYLNEAILKGKRSIVSAVKVTWQEQHPSRVDPY